MEKDQIPYYPIAWFRSTLSFTCSFFSLKISAMMLIYFLTLIYIFLNVGSLFMDNKVFKEKDDHADLMRMLKLPWTHSLTVSKPEQLRKIKCIAVQVACKIRQSNNFRNDLEVFDLSLHDEAEEVRTEAVISMPVMVFWSGLSVLAHIYRQLE